MECGPVRPAHLVGHQTLELKEGALLMGISTKGKSFGCRYAGKSPVFPARLQPSSPRTTTGRSRLDRPSAPVEAASHDLTVVRLLPVSGVRQGELVGLERNP